MGETSWALISLNSRLLLDLSAGAVTVGEHANCAEHQERRDLKHLTTDRHEAKEKSTIRSVICSRVIFCLVTVPQLGGGLAKRSSDTQKKIICCTAVPELHELIEF